ncbi:MAG TPA: hypothetical protein VFT41_13340 [Gemmatimonadaceae bacterium]|nr:hypothetical protein [Gemmatimonadaceae bacterium]
MRAKLVRIGNSRGIRIAKAMLEEAGLTDEVDIQVRGGAVVITAAHRVREGWAEAIERLGPAERMEAPTPTRFDDLEWRWE